MTSSTELLNQALKRHGYSTTKSRLMIFRALEQSGPLTMSQLVSAVAPDVNRASVYRVVALFEKIGVIQRLQIGWKYKLELSNDFQEHHHHLTCLTCGKVIPFHEPAALQQILRTIADDSDFIMQGHQIELTGTCADCRLQASTNA